MKIFLIVQWIFVQFLFGKNCFCVKQKSSFCVLFLFSFAGGRSSGYSSYKGGYSSSSSYSSSGYAMNSSPLESSAVTKSKAIVIKKIETRDGKLVSESSDVLSQWDAVASSYERHVTD